MGKKEDDDTGMPTAAGLKITQVLREIHGSKNPDPDQLHRFDVALAKVEQAYLAMGQLKGGGGN